MARRKSTKRKDPVFAADVVENAKTEIAVLEGKLEFKEIPGFQKRNIENRICTLMNETIPNARAGARSKILV